MQGEDASNTAEDMQSYQTFIKEIDTVLLGWKTYDQIHHELSPEQWMYEDFQSYVFTHKKQASTANIIFTRQEPVKVVEELKQKEGKNIWVCGGANLANQLIDLDLIDCYYISILPIILGKGIALFQDRNKQKLLKLLHTKSYNGICDVVYERR